MRWTDDSFFDAKNGSWLPREIAYWWRLGLKADFALYAVSMMRWVDWSY